MRFQPAGEQARWRYAHDRFVKANVGDVVTYDELAELMGVSPKQRQIVHGAVRRAVTVLEADHHRTVETVRGQGYRVADVKGHLRLGASHQRKAGRALVRGQSKVASVDLNAVADPNVRRSIEVMASAFNAQIEFNTRVAGRMARQQEAMDLLRRESEQTKVNVADVQERLARLEQAMDSAA